MAQTIAELEAILTADSDGLKLAFREAEGASEDLTSSFVKAEVAVAAMEGAFDIVADAAKQGVGEFLDAERAAGRLQQAFQNTGMSATRASTLIDQQSGRIENLSNQYGVSVTDINNLLEGLVRRTGDADVATENLERAMALASATGEDYESVSKDLSEALNGDIDAMRELGILSEDQVREFEDLDYVGEKVARTMEEVDRKTRNYNDALPDTVKRANRLTKEMGEMREAMGSIILSAADIALAFTKWAGIMSEDGELSTGLEHTAQQFRNLAFAAEQLFKSDEERRAQAVHKRLKEIRQEAAGLQDQLNNEEVLLGETIRQLAQVREEELSGGKQDRLGPEDLLIPDQQALDRFKETEETAVTLIEALRRLQRVSSEGEARTLLSEGMFEGTKKTLSQQVVDFYTPIIEAEKEGKQLTEDAKNKRKKLNEDLKKTLELKEQERQAQAESAQLAEIEAQITAQRQKILNSETEMQKLQAENAIRILEFKKRQVQAGMDALGPMRQIIELGIIEKENAQRVAQLQQRNLEQMMRIKDTFGSIVESGKEWANEVWDEITGGVEEVNDQTEETDKNISGLISNAGQLAGAFANAAGASQQITQGIQAAIGVAQGLNTVLAATNAIAAASGVLGILSAAVGLVAAFTGGPKGQAGGGSASRERQEDRMAEKFAKAYADEIESRNLTATFVSIDSASQDRVGGFAPDQLRRLSDELNRIQGLDS